MAVRVDGSEEGARRSAEALAHAARPLLGPDLSMLGPAPAPIERIRGRHRWQILFRAAAAPALFQVHGALGRVARRPPGGASIRFDMDPHAML
jgi:primosomal protein N' (replication factor Y)